MQRSDHIGVRPHKETTFTDKEVEAMVNYYKGRHFLDVRNKLIMVMLFDTGMRCSELCELKVTDVQSNVINIQEGKGKKQRHVPITSAVAKYLMKYQLENSRGQTP